MRTYQLSSCCGRNGTVLGKVVILEEKKSNCDSKSRCVYLSEIDTEEYDNILWIVLPEDEQVLLSSRFLGQKFLVIREADLRSFRE
jgi:hypothetical protein